MGYYVPAGFTHTRYGYWQVAPDPIPGREGQENIERFEANAAWTLGLEIALGRDGWTESMGALFLLVVLVLVLVLCCSAA